MTTPAVIRPSGIGELVSLVPSLLGFHPTESLVAVVLDNSRVQVTARLDIKDAEWLPDVFAKVEAKFPDFTAIALFYTDNAEFGAALAGSLEDHPRIQATGVVSGNVWSSGNDSGRVDSFSAVACEAAMAGMVARTSRTELESLIPPVADPTLVKVDFFGELATLTGEDLDRWLQTYRESASVDALGLAAVSAYLSGDGALANICSDHLPANHPGRTLVELATENVVHPSDLKELITTIG